MVKSIGIFVGLLFVCCSCSSVGGEKKIVIAHRGASGYLPEHSMSAKAMAYAMGVDYIEQDVVVTKDDRLVVLHDRYLDRVTNVAELYSGRAREDGRYYVVDFTLEEIRQLEMTEQFKVKEGKQSAVFSQRFPLWKSSFRVHTLEEEIEMIQGLNHSTGNNIGIYPEIKVAWFYRQEGKDISRAVLNVLKQYGYTAKSDRIYLQSFEAGELRRIHDELFPELGMEVKLLQLIGGRKGHKAMVFKDGKAFRQNVDWIFEPGGMRKIAEYADGIGPHLPMIVKDESIRGRLVVTDMVKDAHDAGMVVHPYTFRADAGKVPDYAVDFEDLLEIFYHEVGIDGAFTDFPDRVVGFLKSTEDK